MHKSLSVVIPVYNCALSVGELVSQLHALLPTLAERYEFELVEDDGRDTSWDVIEALYCGLCNNGVLNSIFNGGFTSSVHGDEQLEKTVAAYATVLRQLRDSNLIATV